MPLSHMEVGGWTKKRTSQWSDAVSVGVLVTHGITGSRSPISCRIGAASAGCAMSSPGARPTRASPMNQRLGRSYPDDLTGGRGR